MFNIRDVTNVPTRKIVLQARQVMQSHQSVERCVLSYISSLFYCYTDVLNHSVIDRRDGSIVNFIDASVDRV